MEWEWNLTKKMVTVKFDKKKEVDFEMKKNNKFNIKTKRNETMWNGNGMLNLAKETAIDKFDKKRK